MSKDPDTKQSIRWLEWLRPGGPWTLTAIPVEGGRTTTATFHDAKAATGWIDKHNGKQNIYFSVNPLRSSMDKKAKKEDVEELAFLHVDVDPRKGEDLAKEQARALKVLQDFSPSPSAIIFSGGGYQGFWRLDEPLYIGGDANRINDAEAYNRQLEIVLGGDHCWNCDRIMRLPGTINLPDEKKRKRGRVEACAEIIELSDISYPLGDFTAAPEITAKQKIRESKDGRGELRRLADPVELEQWGVSPRMRAVIVQGTDPVDPDCYPSRSEAVFAVCTGLLRCGVPPELIVGIITDPSWGIAEHVLAQPQSTKYAWGQVEAAQAAVGPIRPRIIHDESELPRVLDEAEAALLASGVQLYQMNGRLVQPVRLDASSADEHGVRRAAGALVIHGVKDHRLLEHMIAAARFVHIVKDKNGKPLEKPIAPKLKFATHYAERVGAWRL